MVFQSLSWSGSLEASTHPLCARSCSVPSLQGPVLLVLEELAWEGKTGAGFPIPFPGPMHTPCIQVALRPIGLLLAGTHPAPCSGGLRADYQILPTLP